MFGHRFQRGGLILGWSCVEPGVVPNDPCGFHPTWDILWFMCSLYNEQWKNGNVPAQVALSSETYSCRIIVLRCCYQLVKNVLFIPKPEHRECSFVVCLSVALCGRLEKESVLFPGLHMSLIVYSEAKSGITMHLESNCQVLLKVLPCFSSENH